MRFPIRHLASFLLLGILSGCGDSDSTAKVSPVSLGTPAGWVRKDNYPIGVGVEADYVLGAPAINGFSANLIVLTSAVSSMSLDQAVQAEILADQAQLSSLVVDSNVARTVSGYSARVLQFRSVQNSRALVTREIMAKTSLWDIQMVFTRETSDMADSATFAKLESQIRIQ